ncbi:1-deoxy-D-xylulose-5-phosphate reductoisomerase [Vampirovibrio chlorellavorus]|uniref:1-deoxy-D-xylulose-5-phosphate reductoisomerase n=1 Tax=Vampirovibrio chlorellavorus TaxID=758823 RepID=UPI0026F23287|nr:1-deoxy-D-xylulose-5-phosphate reductoisomerase [Vampirovibrio chlorellavorus]
MTEAIALLGSTGSIGTQVLDVVRRMPDRFQIKVLGAGKNLERLAQQVAEFRPEAIAIQAESDRPALVSLLKARAPEFQGEILVGTEGLNALALWPGIDTLIVGLVGLIGLEPSLLALKAGRKLLTANKETFVTGGHLVQPYLSQVVPIDSEHVAIHQCLKQEPPQAISKLYLTASGGPFRTHTRAQLNHVTLQEALKHPNWVMGRKITIDSATMMNKGLEVIEAHWLFGVSYPQIQVIVHPESIIHSGVAFQDGSILMQLGAPDMHGPIQYAMTYPQRLPNQEAAVHLDLMSLSQLNLEPPDLDRFPCVRLAYEAGKLGSGATCVLNGADEMAVQLFLDGKIAFMDIARLLEETLIAYQKQGVASHPDLNEIQALDRWARESVCRLAGLTESTLSAI